LPIRLARTLAAALSGRLFYFAAAFALIPGTMISGIAWSQEYTVTDLGTLGGSKSTAAAVNNLGQVVGWSQISGNGHADPFFYSNGSMKDVFPHGSLYGGAAVGVNNLGHYVVNYVLDGSGHLAVLLYNGATGLGITAPGPAVGINDSDTVLGAAGEGYWLYSNGQLNANPPEPGGGPQGPIEGLQPYAINNSGLVAAFCGNGDLAIPIGCVISSTTTVWLGDAEFGNNLAINSVGATCGQDFDPPSGQWGAGFFSKNGKTTHDYYSNNANFNCLGLDDYGSGVGYVDRLNARATVVLNEYALSYDLLNGAQNLNELIPQGTQNGYSVKVVKALAMSNTGYIAASCSFTKSGGAAKAHACLLTPNAALILKDTIPQLLVKDPSCSACRTGLTSLDDALPDNAKGLTTAEKDHAAATVEKIEAELQTLYAAGDISIAQATFLLHEAEMVMAALGRNQI
jgi:probable HAF family extracellular repeat protein